MLCQTPCKLCQSILASHTTSLSIHPRFRFSQNKCNELNLLPEFYVESIDNRKAWRTDRRTRLTDRPQEKYIQYVSTLCVRYEVHVLRPSRLQVDSIHYNPTPQSPGTGGRAESGEILFQDIRGLQVEYIIYFTRQIEQEWNKVLGCEDTRLGCNLY